MGPSGKAIPGDLVAIDALTLECSARYLLIVEKDAVFQRLAADGLHQALPLVMVTAKGMPDLATRAFCARLLALFPHLVVLGLVDYNPAGLIILRTYKCGSHRMGLESHRFALPSLRWLGLHSSWLVDVEAQHLGQLTARDRALLPGLRGSLMQARQARRPTPGPGASQGQPGQGLGGSGEQGWDTDLDEDLGLVGAGAGVGGGAGMTGTVLNASQWPRPGLDVCGGGQQGGGQMVGDMAAWVAELEVMEQAGFKADIEAVYSVVGYEGLRDMVVQAVLRGAYI